MTAPLCFLRLDLTNYKAYRGKHSITLDMPPGVYLLRGENKASPALDSNGAGKSSLSDALTWCLFGKTLRDEKPGASVEPWTGEKPTEVSVLFSRNKQNHTVTRGRRPNKLLIDGKVATQEEIDKLVGLSYTAFLCTVILPQFGERFLDMRPEAQARLFSETLDLDLWLRASETASALAREAQRDVDRVQSELDTQAGRLEELLGQLEREKQRSSDFAASNRKYIAELQADLKAARVKWEAAKKQSPTLGVPDDTAIRAGEEVVATLRERLTAATSELSDYKAVMAQIDGDLDRMEAELQILEGSPEKCPMCGHKVTAAHFEKERVRLKGEIEGCGAERDAAFAAVSSLTEEMEYLTQQIRSKEESLRLGREKIRSADSAARQHALDVERLKATVDAFQKQINDPAIRVNPYIESTRELETRCEEETTTLEGLQATLDEAEYSKQVYQFWADGYRQIRLDQIDELLRGLEEASNRDAEELGLSGWLMKLVTEKETNAGKTSRGFDTLLYPPGHEKPVRWESFCGVEVQIWQLAVRFALAEMMLAHAGLETNLEILDEPTQHLSPGVVDSLMVSLQNRAERLGRAILLVEHHVFDTGCFAGMITVTHDATGSHVHG